MALKRAREWLPYVDPPSHTWVYDQLQKYQEQLARRVPSRLEADRKEASSFGRVKSWYDVIEDTLDPAW